MYYKHFLSAYEGHCDQFVRVIAIKKKDSVDETRDYYLYVSQNNQTNFQDKQIIIS